MCKQQAANVLFGESTNLVIMTRLLLLCNIYTNTDVCWRESLIGFFRSHFVIPTDRRQKVKLSV